ncbi:MAG: BTAD domain-containing putative transcriptional regulator [Anaerolineae bacterium]
MERRPVETGSPWVEEQTLVETLLSDYRHARALLEELTKDFRAREALVMNGRALMARSAPTTKPSPISVAEAGTRSPMLALFCLGKFRVEIDGMPVDTRAGGKSLAILKFLAGRDGHPTPRDILMEALWPDSDAEAAGNRLRVAVHALRRLLAPAGKSLDILTYQDGCYLLNPGVSVRIDADEFETLWQRGVRLERQGRRAEAAEAYAQAELLYSGDYLEEDLYEEWTLLRRECLRDAYVDLLGKLATWSITEGDYGDCIVRCQKILAQDPCREDAYRLLMRCYAATGQKARALRWYNICAANLRREVGVTPSPQTVALRRRLLQGESP